MKGTLILRFVFIALLWVLLCFLMISGRGFNAWTLFILVISGLIIFVPLYKKYVKNGGNQK